VQESSEYIKDVLVASWKDCSIVSYNSQV